MTLGTHNGRDDLPAGDFGTWLLRMRAALRHETDADVPCGDCCACCSTSHFVHVGPDEVETLAEVPGGLLFAAPGLPAGHVVLPFDARGRCPLLGEGGRCTIYAHRPLTCRTYDCRVFAATGVDADREEIAARARRWRFACAAPADAELLTAVAAAARWIPAHAAAFPGGRVPHDPAQLAVLAIRVADAFLPSGPVARGADDARIAAAIVRLAG
jgi:Fe-S-cluster containining protein